MQRELSYQVPFERLSRLSRSAASKAYASVWWSGWLFLALVIVAVAGFVAYGEALGEWLATAVFIAGLLFLAGLGLLRRRLNSQIKARADFDQIVRLMQDDGGLRFVTEEIEFYLKWPGISQILLEHDGVVVSHGNLFFLVPDKAFANAGDRIAFIRDVYGRLSERARSISEEHVRSALNTGEPRSGA
jgi:hypothetical protein